MTATADIRLLTAAPKPSTSSLARSHADTAPRGLTDVLTRRAEGEALPASYVADLVATRPQGGKRRAQVAHRSGSRRRPAAESRGKRVKRDGSEGALVDATDAAGTLAMASDFWDATQVLAHPEVAKMALAEALTDLAVERDALGSPGLSRKKRRALADIQRRVAALLRAHSLLAEAQERHLVVGD